MKARCYKFLSNNGPLRLRLYESGIYTIQDKTGEHEAGIWEKRPRLVGILQKPSKSKSVYFATTFSGKQVCEYTQLEFARLILITYEREFNTHNANNK